MTAVEAIRRVDALKFNTYEDAEKLAWLGKLEAMLQSNLVETHEGGTACGPVEADTELMAPEAFEALYLRWLEAQMAYHNGETQAYNAAISLFNAEYGALESWYNRNFRPKHRGGFHV